MPHSAKTSMTAWPMVWTKRYCPGNDGLFTGTNLSNNAQTTNDDFRQLLD